MIKVLGVIPVRLASTRLPRKPLADICGQTMVERVWRQASAAKTLSRLIVATDSEEIAGVVRGFGGEVFMTSAELPSGSARVAAVAKKLAGENFSAFVNIQGDMPLIPPEAIDGVVALLRSEKDQIQMATAATPIVSEERFLASSVVKVVLTGKGRALYFSRAPIPFSRDGERPQFAGEQAYGFKHLGLYSYSHKALSFFEDEIPSPLEGIEKLEQLRMLEAGIHIGVKVFPESLLENSVEVDTEEDLERARKLVENF